MTYSNIYFIGIGGIGMSAIARYFKFKGASVSGYDRTATPLTKALEEEGIAVHYTDDCSFIPQDKENTLVVYTPAIPATMGELVYVKENGYNVVKRSGILGTLTAGQHCLAVAGTHGKTTTSTMVAHILTQSGTGCSAFLGGISKNYGTNMLLSQSNTVVVEADEFDRSFLQLRPSISAITAMDADHLDIYGTVEAMQDAYREYASQVKETVIAKYGIPLNSSHTSARIYSYHIDNPLADFHADNMRLDSKGHYTYDLVYPAGVVKDIYVGTIGALNVENSIAAAAICLCFGVDAQKVRAAIGTFQGAVRRLDEHVNNDRHIYIDDYAHHPAELQSSIASLREIFPDKKLTAVFQPHLYTRTRDFKDEFASVLSSVDHLILLPLYPAREEPIEGIDSELLLGLATCPQKELVSMESFLDRIKELDPELLVTFGAGNIDRFINPLTELLSEE